MTKNKVWLSPEDIITIEVVGNQNAASIELMDREISVLITRLRGRQKPILILDSLVDIGNVDSSGRALVVDLGRRLHYDKLAMVGTGGILRLGSNLLLRAIGKRNIRFFTNREAALHWLKGIDK